MMLDEFPSLGKLVSTHSRPKAAAKVAHYSRLHEMVSTHSRPKAAATYRKH